MKTKIQSILAIICLISLSSCGILKEGPRYRLNKVEVVSMTSDSQSFENKKVLEIKQQFVNSDSNTVVCNTCLVNAGCQVDVPARKVETPIFFKSSTSSIVNLPSLRPSSKIYSSCGKTNSSESNGLINLLIFFGIFVAIGLIFGIKAALIALAIYAILCLIAIVIIILILTSL